MPPQLMSPKDLAAWLGVPLATVYRWNSDGCGPRRVTVGRHTRYAEADVHAWLETRTVQAPRAEPHGRTAYRDPVGDAAVRRVMRGGLG